MPLGALEVAGLGRPAAIESRAVPPFWIQFRPRLQAKWEAWANAVSDSVLAHQVPFKSRFVGNAGLPAWQIVVHVVNHATLHRGQIVGMLRQLGMKPPATDILFYYYVQAAPVAS
jgi:uncharacterized damage-inducible protein DinB